MSKETFSVDKDIFTEGMHNGDTYTEKDLDNIVANFNALKAEVKVPLKIDIFKDKLPPSKRHGGEPAFGWITGVTKAFANGKNTLIAHIEDIPRKLKEIIEAKAYRQVSIELLTKFSHGGDKLSNVLRAVALLGVEQPGVEDLTDIWNFYEKESDDEVKIFIVEDNHKEDTHMPLTPEQEKELRDKADKAEREAQDAKTFAVQLQGENKTLKETADAATKQAAELADSQKQAEIKSFIIAKVGEGKLLPKHEGIISQIMGSLETAEVLTFTSKKDGADVTENLSPLAAFKNLIDDMPKVVEFKEKTGADEHLVDEKGVEIDDEGTMRLFKSDETGSAESKAQDFKARKLMKADPKLTYKEALCKVMAEEIK